MNEHGFIRSIHNKLPSEVYRWKIHDGYTSGVPDVMYAGPAGVLFVEYKYLKNLPKKDSTLIRTCLTPIQAAWLERMKHCAPVALMIGNNTKVLILTNNFYTQMTKMHYNEASTTKDGAAKWITSITQDKNCHEQHRQLEQDMGSKKR